MDDTLRQRLDGLPSLESCAARKQVVSCKLCRARAELFDVVDFLKHCSFSHQYSFGVSGIPIRYHRCVRCGFLFTNFFDDWSNADFAKYVYNDDYVIVDPDYRGARPTRLAGIMSELLRGHEALRILDYGAGSGIFAAEMRAAGFSHIEGFDPFSSPERPTGQFDILTCFEALEHTAWPNHAMADMATYLAPSGSVIFTQTVQPPDIGRIGGNWWYLAPRNGHISLFTVEALLRLLPSPRHSLHSNGMLWAIAPPSPDAWLSACLAKIGPAILGASLRPPIEGHDDHWHPTERSPRGAFRWTRVERLTWHLAAPAFLPTKLSLRIPFDMEIEAGFAAGCTLHINGVPAKIEVAENEIRAEALIVETRSEVTVLLRTPRPQSPFELRGAPDARLLGLAMMVV